MVRKGIAVVLFIALCAWVEMLMAPMLLMHTLHAQPVTMAPAAAGHQHRAASATHSCCPGLRKAALAVPLLEFAANSQPCTEQHRCCFQQAPGNAPAPAQDNDVRSLGFEPVSRVASVSDAVESCSVVTAVQPRHSPPAEFGTVLRI